MEADGGRVLQFLLHINVRVWKFFYTNINVCIGIFYHMEKAQQLNKGKRVAIRLYTTSSFVKHHFTPLISGSVSVTRVL